METDRTLIEFDCRPVVEAQTGTFPDGVRNWVEVLCLGHDDLWACGHHHRQWGQVARCMDRHVHAEPAV